MIEELKKGVHCVGVTDWDLRRFHGHELSTHRGSSYNSYLIIDEKVALIDTVWSPFTDQFIENVSSIIDPAKIDYVVANHSEVDHSGSLPEIMRLASNAELIVSRKGLESVKGHYHKDWNFRAVKTGDRISLGKNELIFIEATMLHWPDSMFTYLTGHNILMSNDAFGQHYAAFSRFNDRVDQEELYEEALKYYANILAPFSALVEKKIDELLALNLPIDIIAPSHGIIWRDNPIQIVEKYREWAAQNTPPTAVVVYDTMWNGTRMMAEAIGDGLNKAGVEHKLFNASVTDRNDIITAIFKARTMIAGSPTFNGGILPSIAPVLHELKGMKMKNRLGAAFGAYGWSGEAVKQLEQMLTEAKFDIIAEGVRSKWQPDADELEKCRQFGAEIGKATLAQCKS